MAGEKTELPTQRRLDEARRRGQVARSQDLAQAASLGAALLAMTWAGQRIVEGLALNLTTGLTRLSTTRGHELTSGEVNGLAIGAAMSIGSLVGPVALAAAAAVIASQVALSGWNVATEAITLNFGKLNPANGFTKFGLKQGGVQTLKALAIVSVVFYLAWPFAWRLLNDSQHLVLI